MLRSLCSLRMRLKRKPLGSIWHFLNISGSWASGGLHRMNARRHKRNVFMVLAGVAGLLMKSWFSDSIGEFAYSYLGNLTVSFAVYFIVSIAAGARLKGITIAVIALLVVEIFELTDGFGILANVYDPFDYLANALGVALAYFVDVVLARIIPVDSESP
jgi:hypothetical protein